MVFFGGLTDEGSHFGKSPGRTMRRWGISTGSAHAYMFCTWMRYTGRMPPLAARDEGASTHARGMGIWMSPTLPQRGGGLCGWRGWKYYGENEVHLIPPPCTTPLIPSQNNENTQHNQRSSRQTSIKHKGIILDEKTIHVSTSFESIIEIF